MRIFVLSWFFPPATTSEGIVTYKLLRNSKHNYEVCSALSNLWTYNKVMPMEAENIHVTSIETDNLDEWVDFALELFKTLHAELPFDAFMTRTMPVEALVAGRKLHELYPDVPWIASIADPVAKDPYQIKTWVYDMNVVRSDRKEQFIRSLSFGCDEFRNHPSELIRHMCELKDIEDYAVKNASALIFPHDTLKYYVLGPRQRANAYSIPHTYDLDLFPATEPVRVDERKTLTFVGHSDDIRSLEPLVRALNHVRKTDSTLLDKLHIRLIGNIPAPVRALVYNYYLHNCISIEAPVDYETSLQVIRESDWALHVDARLEFLTETGMSVYFAGKLADYMATDVPILAITGKHSPASYLVESAGGACVEQDDVRGLAKLLMQIARDEVHPVIDRAFRDTFDARTVAQGFDAMVEELVKTPEQKTFTRANWPQVEPSCDEKLLSICVPSYNTELFLDRCLHSLVSCTHAPQFQIIVVNDGSKDATRAIAEAYAAQYPGIVQVINKQNGGHGSTINAALEVATGLYFRVVDGDDWVDAKPFDTLLSRMEDENLYADLVSSNYYQVFADTGDFYPWEKTDRLEDYRILNFADEDFSHEYFTMASMMVKTDILRQADFKLQEHTYYVDVEYILFPIPYVKTIMFSPEYVYRYYIGQAEQSINPEVFVSRYDHHDRVMRRMLAYYRDKKPYMNEGQIAYMESLLGRELAANQYKLALIFDADKKRGSERAREYDEMLKDADERVYDYVGKRYPAIARARLLKFNPASIANIKEFKTPQQSLHDVFRVAARIASKTEIGEHLAHNEFTAKIAHRLSR